MQIEIDKYTLWAIIIITISLVVITLCIVYVVRYYIKQKYNSINKYNENTASKAMPYPENIKQYNDNLINSGVKVQTKNISNKVNGLLKIFSIFKKEK